MRIRSRVWPLALIACIVVTLSAPRLRAQTSPPPQLVPADYDGDRLTDAAIFQPTAVGYATWYVRASSTGVVSARSWGLSTDLPVAQDFDGDGKADLGVYRPSTAYWYVLLSSTNFTTYLTIAPLVTP